MTLGKPKPALKRKKRNNPPIDKAAVLEHRGFLCDCGCDLLAQDLHHAFIGRKKGQPHFDDERNLMHVNHWEHIERKFDNRQWRIKFWNIQCGRYGEEAMQEWLDEIPDKFRHRIDWL
jgi:hypothetical protein